MAAVNNFSSATATANQVVTSTVSKSDLISRIQASYTDSYFDEESEINSVSVTYKHEDGRQKKIITHSTSSLTGQVSWGPVARDGTWQKDFIQVWDSNGATVALKRANIGTGEDIVMTDGTMALNV